MKSAYAMGESPLLIPSMVRRAHHERNQQRIDHLGFVKRFRQKLPRVFFSALTFLFVVPDLHAEPLKLHVPSPDWRDQIIYFLMTDRFNDADVSNNNQGAAEFDGQNNAKYNGGDLRGVTEKLNYIKKLGATAIWITPPVANQWWDAKSQYGGYHGYWAENFSAVDKHLGTLADYQNLSHALHSNGMYLVQDIVVNHTGNFMLYDKEWDAKNPTKGFSLNADARGTAAPSQAPFNLNDPRKPDHLRANIFHWTPDIADYKNKKQEWNFQMSGLDDLNTENPVVRKALRQSYGHWISAVGVDGFRVDTAVFVPPDFYRDFLYSTDKTAPGIAQIAKQTGRENFLSFGEGFAIGKPFNDDAAKKIRAYMTASNGKPLLPGMLNFPLYGALGDVFARGKPTAELAQRIRGTMKLYPRPHLMPTFVDNHDVDRFLTYGSEAALKQSLLAMMTLPGIPVIYYGTEQSFTESRAAMFKAGFKSGGKDRFDTTAPMYKYINKISMLRKEHKLFSRGVPTILQENFASAGVLAYRMDYQHESAWVVFNTADRETLLDKLDTHLKSGTTLQTIFSIDSPSDTISVGANGKVTMKLPARSGVVWKVSNELSASPAKNLSQLELDALNKNRVSEDFKVSGRARGTGSFKTAPFKLVIDGDIASAQTVTPDASGKWQATVDTGKMIDASIRHSVVAWSDADNRISPTRHFNVKRQWKLQADVIDPAGDDAGPKGTYTYPMDSDYRKHRPADIRHVRVFGAAGSMKIELTMSKMMNSWNPANGFDHVAFTIFVGLPDKAGGSRIMPLQQAELPSGMEWHYRLRAHGWSNALFTSTHAAKNHEGTPTAPGADIAIDVKQNKISFTLSSSALGGIKDTRGAKIYITTWDYDGGYRGLMPQAQGSVFGGGEATDPLMMDDTAVITLP